MYSVFDMNVCMVKKDMNVRVFGIVNAQWCEVLIAVGY